MDYAQARAYLKDIENAQGSDYSLVEVAELSARMGRPDRKTEMIHIAGTNGKGSVGNFLCQVLALSGYRVGRFSSPAVFGWRESIQQIWRQQGDDSCFEESVKGEKIFVAHDKTMRKKIYDFASEESASRFFFHEGVCADGAGMTGRVVTADISEEEVAEVVTVLRGHCDAMVSSGFHHPTAFEIQTVMAFQKFVDWDVDVAVAECGLGGRLDATNIIERPRLCVLTSISLDHQQILGDTLGEIAREKYGIIKDGTTVVSAMSDACVDMLEDVCRERGAKLHFVAEDALKRGECTMEGAGFTYRGKEYRVGQLGTFQVENAALAVEALEQLRADGFDRIGEAQIARGLFVSRWPGRLEVVSEKPFVLVDGAHNPSAVRRLVESLETYFPGEKFDFILGVFRDKDYGREAEALLPVMNRVYTVAAPGSRGLSGEALEACIARLAEKQGREVRAFSCDTMKQACSQALEGLSQDGKLVVCGSLSIVGDACNYLRQC